MRNTLRCLLNTALITALGLAGSAGAQTQRIRLVFESHLPQASDLGTTYVARCHSVKHELRVLRAAKSVRLSRADGSEVDLSSTTIGVRLLEDDILVDVSFNCPHGSINIFLNGIKLVDLGAPSGFRDHINVAADGKVGTSSPRPAAIDEMARARAETPAARP